MPQSLQLAWSAPQRIAHIELTFTGHILRQVHSYPPFFRDPQTPRDYAIEAFTDGTWTEVHIEKGNYQRHRVHALSAPVTTSQLRVVFHATNGDPSAALYEIRAYA